MSDIENENEEEIFDDEVEEVIEEVRFEEVRFEEEIQETPATDKVTMSDLLFIHQMVKAVIRGDFGNDDDQLDNLTAFGFTEEQVFTLLSAVDARTNN